MNNNRLIQASLVLNLIMAGALALLMLRPS
jgi:hypothetical protein